MRCFSLANIPKFVDSHRITCIEDLALSFTHGIEEEQRGFNYVNFLSSVYLLWSKITWRIKVGAGFLTGQDGKKELIDPCSEKTPAVNSIQNSMRLRMSG